MRCDFLYYSILFLFFFSFTNQRIEENEEIKQKNM